MVPRRRWGFVTRWCTTVFEIRLSKMSYSDRTQKSCIHRIRGFVQFHSRRRPCELGKAEIASVEADERLLGSVYCQSDPVTGRSVLESLFISKSGPSIRARELALSATGRQLAAYANSTPHP
jgi:hypothetical protein